MRPDPERPATAAGFTLIEMIIVVVVLGILTSLAAPGMTGWVRQSRIDAALNQLTTDVAYARMVAVRAAQPVTLEVEESKYTIRRADSANPVRSVAIGAEYPGLTLVMEPASVVFDSRGFMRSGSGTLVVDDTHSARSATIQITATGRVRRVD